MLSLRAELLVTAAFGLIHGSASPPWLQDLSLTGAGLVIPLLTFNLGLEAAQLLALALVAVQLWLIARSKVASMIVAGVVGLVAVFWLLERALSIPNPLEPLIDTFMGTPERLAFYLLIPAAIAAGTLLRNRIRPLGAPAAGDAVAIGDATASDR